MNGQVSYEVVYDTPESVYFVVSDSSLGAVSLVTSLPILDIGEQLSWQVRYSVEVKIENHWKKENNTRKEILF